MDVHGGFRSWLLMKVNDSECVFVTVLGSMREWDTVCYIHKGSEASLITR
jgi:hypothetical protein